MEQLVWWIKNDQQFYVIFHQNLKNRVEYVYYEIIFNIKLSIDLNRLVGVGNIKKISLQYFKKNIFEFESFWK